MSSAVSGIFGGADAAEDAAGAQSAAIQQAINQIREEFGITEEEFAPFRQAAVGGDGVTGALTRQQEFLGLRGPEAQQAAFSGFMESPGQAFLRQRGEQALVRQASALGGLGGGNVRQALQEQGIGVAAQQQGELQDRLAGLTGLGFQATQGLGRERSRMGETIGGLLTQQGQARASGILGAQQAGAGLASNLLGAGGAILGAGGGGGLAAGLSLLSDERVKTDIHELDLEMCFDAVMNLPLKSWRYLEIMGLGTDTHFGPMAQEAPECIRAGEVDGVEMLDLHDELMLIAGALQYAKQQGMLTLEKESCH